MYILNKDQTFRIFNKKALDFVQRWINVIAESSKKGLNFLKQEVQFRESYMQYI